MKSTKDMRLAALTLLEKYQEERDKKRDIVLSARREVTMEGEKPIEEWIIISWELEITLIEAQIKTILNWLTEDDFDY